MRFSVSVEYCDLSPPSLWSFPCQNYHTCSLRHETGKYIYVLKYFKSIILFYIYQHSCLSTQDTTLYYYALNIFQRSSILDFIPFKLITLVFTVWGNLQLPFLMLALLSHWINDKDIFKLLAFKSLKEYKIVILSSKFRRATMAWRNKLPVSQNVIDIRRKAEH